MAPHKAYVDGHTSPGDRVAAIKEVIDERFKVRGGLAHWITHPDSELRVFPENGRVGIVMPSYDALIDDGGTVHVLCDQYAVIIKNILLPQLTGGKHQAEVRNLIKPAVPGNPAPQKNHLVTDVLIEGVRERLMGIPRFFRQLDYDVDEAAQFDGIHFKGLEVGAIKGTTPSYSFKTFEEFPYDGGLAISTFYYIFHPDKGLLEGRVSIGLADGTTYLVSCAIRADQTGMEWFPVELEHVTNYRILTETGFAECDLPKPLKLKAMETLCTMFGKNLVT